jgi:uracil-DNA glycosylase
LPDSEFAVGLRARFQSAAMRGNSLPMNTDDPAALRALLAFYVEAGVDTVLDEAPVNRLAARSSPPPFAGKELGEGTPLDARRLPGSLPGPPPEAGDGARAAGRPRSQGTPSRGAPTARPAPLPPEQAVMAAREMAASANSLDELRGLLERFEGCGLRLTASRLVFADGNPQARLMIVGEAPGREEDIEGRPFVGRSGQLLDRMLAAIGLDRTQVYIANLVPWRPPGNRTPTPQESQVCLPFLKRQIELADPDILLCLGGPASAALLGMTDGIRKFRGRWRVYHIGESHTSESRTGKREIRAIASFHPSYLLRSPLEKRFAWRDFLAVRTALAQ